MTGFQFPPPPPPPPTSASQPSADSSSGGRGRGRGRGSGRGRGGFNPRSRGHRQTSSFGHGDHQDPSVQQYQPQPTTQHLFTRGGLNKNHSIPSRPHGFPPPPIPAGSHVNPNFHQGTEARSQDLYQSCNASYLHRNEVRNNFGSRKSFSNYVNSQTDDQAQSQSIAGHKRKLDALKGPRSQHESVVRPPAAPIVPAFGASIGASLPTSFELHPKQSPFVAKPWRGSNALGLTPRDADGAYSSSDSDEQEDGGADEDSLLAATLGPGLTFHDSNGEMRSLNTAADLLEWRTERARNFPTRTRLAEKEAQKRRIGAERNRLLHEAREILQSAVLQPHNGKRKEHSKHDYGTSSSNDVVPTKQEPQWQDGDATIKHEQQETCRVMDSGLALTTPSSGNTVSENAAANFDVLSNAHAATTAVNECVVRAIKEGFETRQSKTANGGLSPFNSSWHDADDKESKHATTESRSGPDPDDALPDSNEAASNISSDTEGPEESTSKAPPPAVTRKQVCKFYSASGSCRDGSACRFRHEVTEGVKRAQKERVEQRRKDPFAPVLDQPSTDAKKSIHQRLLEQEEDEENQLALQVIKYLGRVQFFA